MTLRLDFLGSGSRGNACLIRYDDTCILLDCGFGPRELARRLRLADVSLQSISALCVTHEHRDHVAGLTLFKRSEGMPVYLTEPTRKVVRFGSRHTCEPVAVRGGRPFSIGPVEVLPFSTDHDARDPVCYKFTFPDGSRLGMATDLGHETPEVKEALNGCDFLGIEANHDLRLLENGPYPWHLKQRIRSRRGHLSNASAAGLLCDVAGDGLHRVFALHLSETNNRPALARQAFVSGLSRLGLDKTVAVVSQNEPCRYPDCDQLDMFR